MGNCCDTQDGQKTQYTSSINKVEKLQPKIENKKTPSLKDHQINKPKISQNKDKEKTKVFRYEDDMEDDEVYRERPILQQTPEFNSTNPLVSKKLSHEQITNEQKNKIQIQNQNNKKNEQHAKQKSGKKSFEENLKNKNKPKFQIDEEEVEDYHSQKKNKSTAKQQNFDDQLSKIKHEEVPSTPPQEVKRQIQQLISIKDISGSISQKSLKTSEVAAQVSISMQSNEFEEKQELQVVNKQKEIEQNIKATSNIQILNESSPSEKLKIKQTEYLYITENILENQMPKLEQMRDLSNQPQQSEIQLEQSPKQYQNQSQSINSQDNVKKLPSRDIRTLKIFKKMDSQFLKKMNDILGDPEENQRNFNSLNQEKEEVVELQKSQSAKQDNYLIDVHGNNEKKIYKKFDPKFIFQLASSFGFPKEVQKDLFQQGSANLISDDILDRPIVPRKKKHTRQLLDNTEFN